jgi:hypothetical protein
MAVVILSIVGAITAVLVYLYGKGDNDTVIIGVIIAFLGPTIAALLTLEKGFQENAAKIDALHVKTDETNIKATVAADKATETIEAVNDIERKIDGALEAKVKQIIDKERLE